MCLAHSARQAARQPAGSPDGGKFATKPGGREADANTFAAREAAAELADAKAGRVAHVLRPMFTSTGLNEFDADDYSWDAARRAIKTAGDPDAVGESADEKETRVAKALRREFEDAGLDVYADDDAAWDATRAAMKAAAQFRERDGERRVITGLGDREDLVSPPTKRA